MVADSPESRRGLAVAVALFAAAFALAGFWIEYNPQRPTPDAAIYEGIAANLAAGNGYSYDRAPPYRPEITRTPLVPALVAALYRVAGRRPQAALWLNAALIGMAVAMGYLAARRLLGDARAALAGSVLAILAPPVAGASNNVLTEPAAMFQVSLIALLLLGWTRSRREGRTAPMWAALLGAVLASLVLNRPSFTPAILIAAAWASFAALEGRWRAWRAWIAVASLAVTLGAPVLAWSARNASLGLDFSPAPVGASASRVYDIQRYRDHLLDPKERLPRVNARYWSHWKRPLGPEELVELDRKNGEWLDRFLEERSDRVLAAAPHRLLGLFSSFRISIWPPWDGARCDRVMWPIVKWISRALWLLSLAGLALTARRRFALWIWVVPVATLSAVHVLTVCNPRYMIPLMPLLFPYGGAAIMGVWGSVRRAARRFAQST